MLPLIALAARLGIPEPLRRAFALVTTGIAVALLCGALWTCWLYKHDRAVIDKHEAKVTKAVATQSAAASDAAASAVSQTHSTTEQTNADARKAAAGSADPLRAGLDGLRAHQGTPRPAAH